MRNMAENENKTGKSAILCDKILTSQLIVFWLDCGSESFKDEYVRRLRICGLSEENALLTFEYEAKILRKYPRPEMLDADYINKGLFNLVKPVLPEPISYYQTHFEYTLSHILKLEDEASYHADHSAGNNSAAWTEINELANSQLITPYFNEGIHASCGWVVDNLNQFCFHETGMLDRNKWKHLNIVSMSAQDPWDIGKLNIKLEMPEKQFSDPESEPEDSDKKGSSNELEKIFCRKKG